MNSRGDALPDGADLAREIHARAGVGIAARVRQPRELEILRIRVDQPALILVDRGCKSVRTASGACVRATPGQALTLDGHQTVDFSNSVDDGTHYEARWLVFDPALLADAHYRAAAARIEPTARGHASASLLAPVQANLAEAFERACRSLAPSEAIPDAIARQRVLEVMHWLLEAGIVLRHPPIHPSASLKVRALIAGQLDRAWTADRVAAELAQSEATLRRRLAAEGTSLSQLLADARMAAALLLLQATTRPVSQIALSVGYESPSRFAVRFRQRFGFAPTALRGHERAN